MIRSVAAWSLCVSVATAVAAAQLLRTRTDVVEVDVVVTDRQGHPVQGLQPSDFVIHEDGVPVSIAAFEAVVVSDTPRARPQVRDDESGAAVDTNEIPDGGRLIVILVDDLGRLSPSAAARAKRVATGIIERLGPADLTAVLATSWRARHQTEFTTDRRRLLATLDGLGPFESIAGGDTSMTWLRSRDSHVSGDPRRRRRHDDSRVADAASGGGAGYVVRVPLAGRKAGSYTVRVEIVVRGRRITRSLPFLVVH